MMIHSVNSDIPEERIKLVNQYMNENLEELGDEMKDVVLHLPKAGGKRLRPLVFILMSEYLGNNPRELVPIACSIEALHTSTLIQDDHPDMDNDDMRRGVETVHEKFGRAESQLASNILISKSFSWIKDSDLDKETQNKCTEEIEKLIEDLCIGQKLDLDYEGRTGVTEDDYIRMASLKTASIYESAAKMAAIVSGSDDETISDCASFGYHLGMGFQMVDDIIDLKRSGTGKDSYSDIINQKSTIVNVHAINSGVSVFDNQIPIERRVQMIRDVGSVKYGKELAKKHVDRCLNSLKSIDGQSEDSAILLEQIAKISLDRTH